jgi:hypothetical protein
MTRARRLIQTSATDYARGVNTAYNRRTPAGHR